MHIQPIETISRQYYSTKCQLYYRRPPMVARNQGWLPATKGGCPQPRVVARNQEWSPLSQPGACLSLSCTNRVALGFLVCLFTFIDIY